MIRTTLAFAAAAVALGALPAAAQEAAPHVAPTVVSYSDLDLGKASDARILMGRLHTAAAAVCDRTDDGADPLQHYAEWGRCMSQTMNSAVAGVHSPVLTAMRASPAAPVTLARR